MRVFVAGATGVIGRHLIPRLVARDHAVVASTTTASKCDSLLALGAEAVVMDGLDAASVREAVERARPEVVVHQMTALARGLDLRHFDASFAVTNRLRTAGTEHLLAAAAAGARRFVAQSYTGWTNARDGRPVHSEEDPLDPSPPAAQRRTLDAIRGLEHAVLDAGMDGVVLRYGSLYGPGASDELVALVRRRRLPVVGGGAGVWSWLHVEDAAAATVIAVEGGATGTYNVVDDEPAAVAEWLPHLAACLGARPPGRVPSWVARPAVGAVGISMMTQVRGSSNARARRELGWRPRWASWRDGFRQALLEQPGPDGVAQSGRAGAPGAAAVRAVAR